MAEPQYSPEVENATAAVHERLKDVIPDVEWPVHAPYIAAINELKREMNAVLLVHNYQTPEIFHGVADFVGDSLALARKATEVDADIIVQCGVHFMAETTKLLNPEKTVLIPDLRAGCSLASSITGADVVKMREQHPGVPVVSYVNTTADVKAETDRRTAAIQRLVLEEVPVARICEEFDVDRGAVYTIKWRVTKRVAERMSQLTEADE